VQKLRKNNGKTADQKINTTIQTRPFQLLLLLLLLLPINKKLEHA